MELSFLTEKIFIVAIITYFCVSGLYVFCNGASSSRPISQRLLFVFAITGILFSLVGTVVSYNLNKCRADIEQVITIDDFETELLSQLEVEVRLGRELESSEIKLLYSAGIAALEILMRMTEALITLLSFISAMSCVLFTGLRFILLRTKEA